jgi:hypothetical protein
MVTAAVIDGSSKLAAARRLRAETAARSLGLVGLEACDEDDLCRDGLAAARQQAIEDVPERITEHIRRPCRAA